MNFNSFIIQLSEFIIRFLWENDGADANSRFAFYFNVMSADCRSKK